MQVKILYWSPDGKLIFLEHFHSITDCNFHFKIRFSFSGLLNCTIDSNIKVLNHVHLTLANDHDTQKSETCIQNISLIMNRLNELIIKLACWCNINVVSSQKVMKFQVLKVESANSTMSRSLSQCDSFMIPVTTLIM